MDKSAKGRLDKISPEYEVIKPLLAIVIIRSGKQWAYPFVVARSILIDMVKTSPEIDVDEFWNRFKDRIENPPKPKRILTHRFSF